VEGGWNLVGRRFGRRFGRRLKSGWWKEAL